MMSANAVNKKKASGKPAQPTKPADAADAVFIDMSQAFQKGDRKRLATLLPQAKGHKLEPWAAFWEWRLRLGEASDYEVKSFLQRYAGTYQEDRMRNDWLLLLGVAAITLLAVALIGWLIARWVARPLASLEQKADEVGKGDLTARAPEDNGPPEVRALAHRFNVMVGPVEALVGAQEAFVADASHQLRTPLTAMRLRIENLGAGAGPAGEEDAEAAIAEVDRLSRMVDSLLALARAERAESRPVVVDVSVLVADRADAWTDLAAESGVSMRAEVAPGLRARVADGVLEQVVDNLVDNAVTAAPDGGEVVVSAEGDGAHVRVTVTDTGRGMTAEERQHAFDRFWRSTRSSPGAGSGLGLAIVKRLVEGSGGTVALEDAPSGTGLRVVVDLPRA
jgi:signal transduction histidine kinase